MAEQDMQDAAGGTDHAQPQTDFATGEQVDPATENTTVDVGKTKKLDQGKQDHVIELLKPYEGMGMEVVFDTEGGITFRAGEKAESINGQADDEQIKAAAKRVAAR